MASKDKETGTTPPEDNEKFCPAMEMQGCCPMGPMIGIPPMAMQQMPMQPMVGWPPMNMAMPGMVQGGINCPLAGEMNGMKCGFKNWEEKFQSMSKKIDEIHKMVHDMQKKNR